MADIIQLRRDTAADWTAAATVLLDGEIGIETDTNTFKVGDGSTAWASLSYYTGSISLDILDNVTITSNASGEILKWNGSAWINQTLSEAGIATAAQGTLANSAQQPPSEGAFADGDKTKLDGAIQNSLIAAKGDLIGASANDTPLILSVGANDFVLTADSAEASGMKWAEPASGVAEVFHARDEKASGTNGGSGTSNTWINRDINTVVQNTITGASLASDTVTLPAGTYRVSAYAPYGYLAREVRLRLYDVTNSAVLEYSHSSYQADSGDDLVWLGCDIVLSGTVGVRLESFVKTASNSATLGQASVIASVNEYYANIFIEKLG